MLTGIGAFCFCEFVAVPQYSATGSIMVTNGSIVSDKTTNFGDNDELYGNNDGNIDSADITASLNFTYTLIDILNTPDLYMELSEKMGGTYTYNQLKSLANVARRSNNTLFIDVSFNANSREEAMTLVNTYLEIAPDYINEYAKGVRSKPVFADNASQTYPRTILATGISGLLGALIAYAILFLVYCANTVIKGEDDFKDRFDIPVLGCIPDFSASKNDQYYKKYNYGKGAKKENGK